MKFYLIASKELPVCIKLIYDPIFQKFKYNIYIIEIDNELFRSKLIENGLDEVPILCIKGENGYIKIVGYTKILNFLIDQIPNLEKTEHIKDKNLYSNRLYDNVLKKNLIDNMSRNEMQNYPHTEINFHKPDFNQNEHVQYFNKPEEFQNQN